MGVRPGGDSAGEARSSQLRPGWRGLTPTAPGPDRVMWRCQDIFCHVYVVVSIESTFMLCTGKHS